MTSKFEEMGHRFGDKFVVVKDYHNLKVGDIVTSVGARSDWIYCVKEGDQEVSPMYFCGDRIEVIYYKEESTVGSKTNILNVGEVGSPRYEVIRKVLAVLDGDMVRIGNGYEYSTGYSHIERATEALRLAINKQTDFPQKYQLQSEQQPVLSEKDINIKELEDNIESMKKKLEELKGM